MLNQHKYESYFRENQLRHIARMREFLQQPCIPSEGIGGKETIKLISKYLKELGFQEIKILGNNSMPGIWVI